MKVQNNSCSRSTRLLRVAASSNYALNADAHKSGARRLARTLEFMRLEIVFVSLVVSIGVLGLCVATLFVEPSQAASILYLSTSMIGILQLMRARDPSLRAADSQRAGISQKSLVVANIMFCLPLQGSQLSQFIGLREVTTLQFTPVWRSWA